VGVAVVEVVIGSSANACQVLQTGCCMAGVLPDIKKRGLDLGVALPFQQGGQGLGHFKSRICHHHQAVGAAGLKVAPGFCIGQLKPRYRVAFSPSSEFLQTAANQVLLAGGGG